LKEKRSAADPRCLGSSGANAEVVQEDTTQSAFG
jgi:hypothetical protein